MATVSARLSGRPRVEELEGRILEATQDLLIEAGYGGTTIAAVADRAHCGKSAIYRRWETKVDLVVAAVRASQIPPEVPDTGSLREDLLAAASHCGLRCLLEPVLRSAASDRGADSTRCARADHSRARDRGSL